MKLKVFKHSNRKCMAIFVRFITKTCKWLLVRFKTVNLTHYFIYVPTLKDYGTLGVGYRDLQARVYKQETRNLTQLLEAQPSSLDRKFQTS